jgi:rubredoxin
VLIASFYRIAPARRAPGAPLLGNLLPMSTTTETMQRWICESCGFIYDPEDGDPDGGIPAGTAFEDIPDTWFCPVCGARKRDFVLYEA